jgi:hypothetical protein
MATKRAPKNNDPSVTEGVGPEADDETKARLKEADEANIAANEPRRRRRGRQPRRQGRQPGRSRAGRRPRPGRRHRHHDDEEHPGHGLRHGATFAALFTADPGTTGTATGEVTATGAPAYARKPFTAGAAWSAASNGVVTASVTFDVPAGTTVTFVAVCSSVTQGAATVLDRIAITSQPFGTQGTLTVNFTFTQS